ncbi:hypothetical protein [Aurantibacillus circumpalustris]|uniref:hypothetical protein n=1 Tax=Aurantibacillus circumpalustris TaxID=3036359 RepID=UPI00295B6030|nr:hypothetical protein [Aurantibacillus circumpalustris]
MENLPFYVQLLFVVTTILTLWFIYKASSKSNLLLGVFMAWLLLQGFIANTGFYLITTTLPPRFSLLVVPPVLTILFFFATKKGRMYLDKFDTKTLTYLHSVRLPVEITLWLLFLNKLVPELMTFEGRNLDVLTGITAPLIAYFGYSLGKLNKFVLLIWNFIGLGLFFNIVITAILSAPFPFQQLAFDQPNIGVLYFPFVWLPCFIVPLALFSHLVCIKELLKSK